MELKIILGIAIILAVYLTLLFFTNKEKFKSTVKVLSHQAEWLFSSGILKREWVDKQIDLFISTRYPMARFVLKFIVKMYADKFIEAEVKIVNETTKHIVKQVVEKAVDKSANKFVEKLLNSESVSIENSPTLINLTKELKLEAKDKGFIVLDAGVKGNTAKEGVDYYGEIGIGRKF